MMEGWLNACELDEIVELLGCLNSLQFADIGLRGQSLDVVDSGGLLLGNVEREDGCVEWIFVPVGWVA